MESTLLPFLLLLELLGRAELRSAGAGCIYIQDMVPKVPEVPEYLQRRTDTDLCRGTKTGSHALQCGNSNTFIEPKCVCTFHHVTNANYRNYTACRKNEMADSLSHLTCKGCKNFSVNKAGPCLNGGSLICKDETMLIRDLEYVECRCLEGYSGQFCQYENKNLTRTCVPASKENHLAKCSDDTNKESSCGIQLNNITFVCSSTSNRGGIMCDENEYFFHQDNAISGGTNDRDMSWIICFLILLAYKLFLQCFVEL